jgi:hypothetical protein
LLRVALLRVALLRVALLRITLLRVALLRVTLLCYNAAIAASSGAWLRSLLACCDLLAAAT